MYAVKKKKKSLIRPPDSELVFITSIFNLCFSFHRPDYRSANKVSGDHGCVGLLPLTRTGGIVSTGKWLVKADNFPFSFLLIRCLINPSTAAFKPSPSIFS